MLKIERGIEISAVGAYRGLLEKMDIGDSVLDNAENTTKSKFYGAAKRYERRSQKKFVARTVDGGVRVWRVE